jgi:hypothetical protein
LAFAGIFWTNEFLGADVHVLRGQVSRPLNAVLGLLSDSGTAILATATLPPDVTAIAFTPIFPFTAAANGISVNAATGAVTAAAVPALGGLPPSSVKVPNFIIQVVVTHTSAAAPNPLPPISVRVHVHDAVTRVTLGPHTPQIPMPGPRDPALTVRVEPPGLSPSNVRFSVFAEFDDGPEAAGIQKVPTVGNISLHPGLTWTATDLARAATADLTINPATGAMVAKNPGKTALVTVKLPADMGGGSANEVVQTAEPWSTPKVANLVPVSPGAKNLALPNLLFLSDGFLDGEQRKFEVFVGKIFEQMRNAKTTFPFNRLRPQINVWTVFVPSRQRGATALNALRFVARGPKRTPSMDALPIPEPPDPVHGVQSVEQLLWQVGLPIRSDQHVAFAAKQQVWNQVYGAAHTAGITAAIYSDWTSLWDYSLALDQDTAFGLCTGNGWPQVSSADDGRQLYLHPFRAQRPHIDAMLKALTTLADGVEVPLGATWTTGKDRSHVVILSAGARSSGAEHEIVASDLGTPTEINILDSVLDSSAVAISPYPIPDDASFLLRANIAHELGHTLQLGDEYGGAPKLTDPSLIKDFWNLKDEASLTNPAHGLDGGKIPWAWPRMIKTAVLQQAPDGIGKGPFRFLVGTGQAVGFRANDTVRLRTRPVNTTLVSSASFTVTNVTSVAAGDQIDAKLVDDTQIFLKDLWPKDTLIYVPRLDTAGHELTLLDDRVRDWITRTGIPLNRLVIACTKETGDTQAAVNHPPGLTNKKPRWSPWMIGLMDGGDEFDCGVFHPSGACIMRQLLVSSVAAENPGVPYIFCGVCRYILVDILDPTLHPAVDDEFAQYFSLV